MPHLQKKSKKQIDLAAWFSGGGWGVKYDRREDNLTVTWYSPIYSLLFDAA